MRQEGGTGAADGRLDAGQQQAKEQILPRLAVAQPLARLAGQRRGVAGRADDVGTVAVAAERVGDAQPLEAVQRAGGVVQGDHRRQHGTQEILGLVH